MLKGAIFDMDGVIVDSHPAHERAWTKALRSLGKSMTEADLEFIREGRKRDEIIQRFLSASTEAEIRWCRNQKDLLFEQEAENIRTLAGLQELLGELNNGAVRTAVASCGSQSRVHRLLDLLQLKGGFGVVLTGDDVAQGKPDPEIFLKAAERMGLQPSEVVVFEDSRCGVLAARAAGMKCIGIASPRRAQALIESGALQVIPDFLGASLAGMRQWFCLSVSQTSYATA